MDPALAPTSQFGPFAIGAVLASRYEILAPLGEGGMGAVYRALDRTLEEEVALKVLRPELAANADALARFHREVKLARRVTHANVARTYDLGFHEGTRFITMELIHGESLAVAARRGVALPEALRIAHEACLGLIAAHAVGVVHRDFKPDNVMLEEQRVKLTDFGIARALGAPDAHTVNAIVGTPAYMAPEQVEGHAIDGRTDVYAFGVMLFELTTRRLPWDGDSPFALAAARLLRPAPRARDVAADVPDGVDALIAHMLQKKREDRPDAASVADELERLRGVRARTLSPGGLTSTLSNLPSVTERAVVLRPFDGEPAELAASLEAVLGDALVNAKGLTVALLREAPNARGDVALAGSVRAAGDTVRVRVRLVEPVSGVTTWADQIDGTKSDPFALEDALVSRVVPAIVHRCGGGQGPGDPAVRARWEEARALYAEVAPASVMKATAIAEEILTSDPKNPWAMALLALCGMRTFTQIGSADQTIVARSEELALRALDIDPRVADAYYAVALVRWATGDYRGVIQADQEALRRNPLFGDAHAGLASVLADLGSLDAALQRVDVAIRLQPRDFNARATRVRTLALLGRVGETKTEIQRMYDLGGGAAVTSMEARLVFWWGDREHAGLLAERMTALASKASWDSAIPALRAYARNEADPDAVVRLETWYGQAFGASRGLILQIATEYFAAIGDREQALSFIRRFEPRTFWSLGWLDHCPALACVRDSTELAALRVSTAERVARLLD